MPDALKLSLLLQLQALIIEFADAPLWLLVSIVENTRNIGAMVLASGLACPRAANENVTAHATSNSRNRPLLILLKGSLVRGW
ncbi:MAG TPA: hypothetical protein VK658_18350 [Chryseolinea sp.]|nr:hypothetical protein [Chryseolinea sp.]